MLGMCVLTSGGDPATYADVLRRATASTPLALALLERLGAQLGCEPTNEAVSAARLERLRSDATGYLQELWRDARIEGLVVDEGFPLPIIPSAELEREAGVRRASRRAHRALDRTRTGTTRAATAIWRMLSARASRPPSREGAIAFKSVIAYRTGLDITQPSAADARAAFTRWREDGFRETREHAKPVRDRLLARTLEVASASGVPVHIHSGGGDPDSLVPHARPAGPLRPAQAPPAAAGAADPRRLAVDGRGRVHGLDPPPRLPRSLDRHPLGLARDRPPDRDGAGRRAALEGALRLRRGERARGRLVLGARRPRGTRRACSSAGVEHALDDARAGRPGSARTCSPATAATCTGSRAVSAREALLDLLAAPDGRARAGRARERRAHDLRRAARGRRSPRPLARGGRRRPGRRGRHEPAERPRDRGGVPRRSRRRRGGAPLNQAYTAEEFHAYLDDLAAARDALPARRGEPGAQRLRSARHPPARARRPAARLRSRSPT